MLSFGFNHYVPILKTKQGERWSLATLSGLRRAHLTPLLEVHAHKTLGPTAHASVICESLVEEWGTNDYFFLDTRWLHAEVGDPAVIAGVLQSARDSSLLTIPVATIQYDAIAREQLAAEIEVDGRGCLIRVRPSDLQEPEAVLDLANNLGLVPADLHLLLDYRSNPMNLEFDLNRIPALDEWRTVTVASGSFPRSLADRPLNEWFTLSRAEWNAWFMNITEGMKRRPSFADYTTRDPGAPANGGKPSVNIRYARSNDWLCRLGGRLEDGAAPQMKTFCSLLTAHESYSGQTFSEGDAEYYDKSLPDTGTGGSGDWTKWAISHHLAFVADQVASIDVV
jgi:hypothetical protein